MGRVRLTRRGKIVAWLFAAAVVWGVFQIPYHPWYPDADPYMPAPMETTLAP